MSDRPQTPEGGETLEEAWQAVEALREALRAWESPETENHDASPALRAMANRVAECAKDLLAALSAPRVEADPDGVALIRRERERQVSEEGWTPEHDDTHKYGDLAVHAAALAVQHTDAVVVDPLGRGTPHVRENEKGEGSDAWGLQAKHGGDRLRRLAIAGALIAAEIDRVRRAEAVFDRMVDDRIPALPETTDDE